LKPPLARSVSALAAGTALLQPRAVQLPDLQALARGDAEAWDAAFRWLWPAAFGAAQLKLQPFLPGDVEDVAIEALEQLVELVPQVKTVEELKPLAASIAHHRAVSRLREHFAAKRGSGQTASLEARAEEGREDAEAAADSPLASLERKELAGVLRKLLADLKPPQGELLADFFLHGLSYEEMAKKHGLAEGSVGVYLKRGLESVRRAWERRNE
jgi:RNA polymerase sigma factor (sigma-70 family)